MTNILISNPNSYDLYLYIPYIYGMLRWTCSHIVDLYWCKPIYENKPADILLKDYDIKSLSVLGLSCYTWNRDLNYRIAEIVKQANPQCLVIAGGPEPDSEDDPQQFLYEYPDIDIIVKRDADYSFPLIMKEVSQLTYNFNDIPGLYINGYGDTGPVNYTKECPTSVYTTYSPVYAEIAKEIRANNKYPVQVVETDRGCPYNCAFCYRGRYDNKETVMIPLEHVYKDIEWAGQNKIEYIDIGNSNWGRYKRDLSVAKKLVETKKRYGYPTVVYYSGAKTHSKNMAEMIKILNESDMLHQHAIALQTTNKAALKAAKRVNMPKKEYLYLAETAADKNIPVGTQFIIGCPGDTYDGVKQTCADVMDMGLMDISIVLPYQVLPGSWACTQEYRDEWQLETVFRHNQRQRRKKNRKTEMTSVAEYIVGCKTFTSQDYMDMWKYYAIFLAFVGGNISKFISIYLKLNHGIGYLDFYSSLIEVFCSTRDYPFMYFLNKRLQEKQRLFVDPDLSSNNAFWEFEHYSLESYCMYEYDECLLISMFLNFDTFRKEFSKYILETYSHIDKIESILQFQTDILITKDFKLSKIIPMKYDWIKYFKSLKANRWIVSPGEPDEINKFAKINQTHCGATKAWPLKWDTDLKYIETVVGTMYQRTNRNTFALSEMEIS